MYCVIQEVERKRKNQNGYPKELKSEYMQMSINGQDESHYWHHYSKERFERNVKKAYRITIHESYRENGKVKKKQFGICTVDYYDLATERNMQYLRLERRKNRMSVKIKVSYTTDQELQEIVSLLSPVMKNVKIKPQKGKFKRAYISQELEQNAKVFGDLES